MTNMEIMYCHICGKELEKETKVCPECGMAVPETRENRTQQVIAISQNTAAPRTQNEGIKRKKEGMICPQCGADNLQVTNETNTNTTTTGSGYSASKGCCGYIMFGPLGLLCGACNKGPQTTTTTTNTMYFVCPKCGKKFRNPTELREAAEKSENSVVAATIALPIAAVLAIVAGFIMSNKIAWIICIIAAIFSVILTFVCRHLYDEEARRLYEEANQIEKGMDKHR